jgi:MFS family permease
VFYGWWIVLVGLIAQAVGAGTVSYSYSVVAHHLGQEFQAGRMMMMAGITGCTLVGGLVSPLLGSLTDRHPMRLLMIAGALSLAVGFNALSFTRAMWQVAVCYALFMSSATMLLGPLSATTLIARWFSNRRGVALGIAAIGTSLGGFVFPPLLEFMMSGFGWRVACRLLGVLILGLTVPLAWFLVIDHPADKGLNPDGAHDTGAHATAAAATAGHLSTAAILRRPEFWLIALGVGVLFAVYTAVLTNLVPLAVGRGLTAGRAAMLVSLLSVAGIIGKLLFGLAADRVDLRLALAAAMLLVCLALALFRALDPSWLLWCGSGALGLAAGGMLPVWGAMLGKAFGVANYGRAMGLMTPVLMPFTLVSPPLAGWIFDVTGDYSLVFEVFFVAVAVSALALTRLPAMRQSA